MSDFEDKQDRDDELERALRSALRPLPAPAGFAQRVLERTRDLEAPQSSAFRKRPGFHPTLRWAIAAVLLVAVALGGFFAHQRQRRIEGERARDQVLLALRLTSITIRAVRNQVNSGSHNNEPQQETP